MHMAEKKMASNREVLQLYRQMLRMGKSFSSYNYRDSNTFLKAKSVSNTPPKLSIPLSNRMYAIRRIKDAFRENKDITDPEKRKSLILKAQDNLEVMKRQVFLGQMYRHARLVIEKK